MLTPFGIALRKLRLDQGMRLLDLAARLNLSSAFVSAIETGRKPIPAGYVKQVIAALSLSAEDASELQKAADRSRTEVRVDTVSAQNRDLVAAFARRVDELSPEILAELRQRIFKSSSSDVPFRRQRKGLLVAPTSRANLRCAAEVVRSAFVPPIQVAFPIMDVVEFKLSALFPNFFLDVGSREVLGEDEGRVVAGKNCILLRDDVYEAAWKGHGRARFTVAHELGHFLMHREVTLARVRDDCFPIYRDAEWQADEFAGGLLMSARHLGSFANAEDAARQCGMSDEAARVMWAKYQKEGAM